MGEECINHLIKFVLERVIFGFDNPLTRKPSDGSVPAMAPALAAVRDSTSSSEDMDLSIYAMNASLKWRTDEDDNETILVFYHFRDAIE